jgi:hypothetical protein
MFFVACCHTRHAKVVTAGMLVGFSNKADAAAKQLVFGVQAWQLPVVPTPQ